MKKILVLCTGNSCRSQMAHGYLEKFAAGKAAIYSAGIETHGLNQRAVKVMLEDGVDISSNTSNNVLEYLDIPFDYILTVCDHANENCPYIPGNAERFHYNFPDPAKATGTEDEILEKFRYTQGLVKAYCQEFLLNKI
ncbi:MAG: arsenate reductase ArsC [Bacteroidia bacterium]|nr:arsenate reductase ArsC [Bacteroidia bacterium]MCF8425298.1 arsenate reductase ArsC [Bacteroidia bacterium]